MYVSWNLFLYALCSSKFTFMGFDRTRMVVSCIICKKRQSGHACDFHIVVIHSLLVRVRSSLWRLTLFCRFARTSITASHIFFSHFGIKVGTTIFKYMLGQIWRSRHNCPNAITLGPFGTFGKDCAICRALSNFLVTPRLQRNGGQTLRHQGDAALRVHQKTLESVCSCGDLSKHQDLASLLVVQNSK